MTSKIWPPPTEVGAGRSSLSIDNPFQEECDSCGCYPCQCDWCGECECDPCECETCSTCGLHRLRVHRLLRHVLHDGLSSALTAKVTSLSVTVSSDLDDVHATSRTSVGNSVPSGELRERALECVRDTDWPALGHLMMVRYYDKEGKPLTSIQWAQLMEFPKYRVIASDNVGRDAGSRRCG